jgi:hypothetical protein
MGLLAALLNIGQDAVTLASLSTGLIVFSPWLMALLAAAVIPSFLGETHFTSLAYSVLYKRTPERRKLDYLRLLGASVQSAKEVKIFDWALIYLNIAMGYQRIYLRKQGSNSCDCQLSFSSSDRSYYVLMR